MRVAEKEGGDGVIVDVGGVVLCIVILECACVDGFDGSAVVYGASILHEIVCK